MVIAFPEVRVTKIDPDCEFILLGCDGLWELKSTEILLGMVHVDVYGGNFEKDKLSMPKLKRGLEKLVDEQCAKDIFHHQGKGMDNISAIIVEFRR